MPTLASEASTTFTHRPVLLEPFVSALCADPGGRYVDATFGRGGHSCALLARLSPAGRLLGLDRDPLAVAAGEALAAVDPRFSIAHTHFGALAAALDAQGWQQVDGIGFDLGISSPQVDDAARGFSFQASGPLDMRMNPEAGKPLSELLKKTDERRLTAIIRDYGDERYAARIARRILEAVQSDALHTTRDLENICFHAVPANQRHQGAHPATRTFQALRIWVNDEENEIRVGLAAAMQRLASGGRLAVISFHSGEDRLVRDLIEEQVNPCRCPREFPICVCGKKPTMRWLQKKPIRADEQELAENPRSRSAMLRVAERLAEGKPC